jgi:hypothetical protein
MKEDVLKRIEDMVKNGTEIILKQNSDYEKWVVTSTLLSNIAGLCRGARLMVGKEEV